jgi:hypothetical protein
VIILYKNHDGMFYFTGQACEKTANEIISVLDKVNQKIPEHVTGRVKQGENLIQKYGIYRYVFIILGFTNYFIFIFQCSVFIN